jgi:acyl carrier protein
MNNLTLTRRISALKEASLTSKIRAFIAEHLSVDVESITADSHFSDDLGLDLLDVVELTILLEDQFTKGCATDEAVQMEFVGDLICHIEGSNLAMASGNSQRS